MIGQDAQIVTLKKQHYTNLATQLTVNLSHSNIL